MQHINERITSHTGERISTRHAFLQCLKCVEAREKLTFLMRCEREKILLPSNSRKNVDFDLLIEQQNKIFWNGLIYLKRLAKGDAEAWKMLNDHERRAIYKESNKTKLRFVKKLIWEKRVMGILCCQKNWKFPNFRDPKVAKLMKKPKHT